MVSGPPQDASDGDGQADTLPAAARRARRVSSDDTLVASEDLAALAGARTLVGADSPGPRGAPSVTVSSPRDAMHLEEAQRTRIFLYFALLISGVVLAALPLVDGPGWLESLLAVSVTITIGALLGLHRSLRDPATYDPRWTTLVAWWTAVTVCIGVWMWGVFSAAPALLVMGIYFFSRNQSLRATVLIYATCAVLHAGGALAIITGTLADPGLFPVTDQPATELWLTLALIQLIFAFSFLIARATRRSSLQALEQLEGAVRQLSRREALLLEAQGDLARALQVGDPGRYTDQVLQGYRLGVLLGRGGMGEVYEAQHERTGEAAAVKLLHPHVLDHPESVSRFFREAEAAGAFATPHVVRILAASAPGEPLPYLVMERLRGRDLAVHLRRVHRLGSTELLELVAAVGAVLDEARAHGIVHRDLKPSNVFRAETSAGRSWKVLDFGMSKLIRGPGSLTQGRVVGTPAYMSPEQARGKAVDHRTDLYALATIVYRAVTGRPPFVGDDTPGVLYRVCHEQPPRPSDIARLPEALDHVLAIGMAKSPGDRFDDAAALHDALARALGGADCSDLASRAEAIYARTPWPDVTAAQ